jgi:hypothetical protein
MKGESVLCNNLAAFCMIVCLAAGCATVGRDSSLDALHVFSVPVAVDLDGLPGADGISLTLYASTRDRAKGIPIADGQVEIMMFDGALLPNSLTNAQPLRVWTFPATELKSHLIQSSLGNGYRFTLRWMDTAPSNTRITIVARVVSPRRTSVQSMPTIVAVPAK